MGSIGVRKIYRPRCQWTLNRRGQEKNGKHYTFHARLRPGMAVDARSNVTSNSFPPRVASLSLERLKPEWKRWSYALLPCTSANSGVRQAIDELDGCM